jgi:hypothetical protein
MPPPDPGDGTNPVAENPFPAFLKKTSAKCDLLHKLSD